MSTELPHGANDFDFFIGSWQSHSRKRVHLLQQDSGWEEFDASTTARKLPGEIGNYDDFVAPAWRPGFLAMSLRIYNPETRLWSIFWLTNRTGGINASTGTLQPPVVGSFIDGVGVFECDDDFEGQPIRVRYTWSHITPESARWQQAFSTDGGHHWDTNWVMEMRRTSAAE
ncbi:hypothetical protein [Chitinimonas naiadis]